MICKVCGREIKNEEANFCEYCGTSFRPGTSNKVSEEEYQKNAMGGNPFQKIMNPEAGAQENRQNWSGSSFGANYSDSANTDTNSRMNSNQGQNPNMRRPGSLIDGIFGNGDKPMTFGNWLLIYLLPFIPMVGTILLLVILFSWGFGANVPETKKNWARATLVFGVIMIVVLTVFLSSGMMGDYASLLNGMTDGGV